MNKKYTDMQLMDRVKNIGGRIVPDKYLIVGVQSNADSFNVFDDKFYLYLGGKFIMVTTGTTNAGATALLHFDTKGNKDGAAVLKTNEFYSDAYTNGKHRGRMQALRQNVIFKYYRDDNKNKKAEEIGKMYEDKIVYANFHGVSYDPASKIIKTNINGWSMVCQVVNNMVDYHEIIKLTKANPYKIDYALLKEF